MNRILMFLIFNYFVLLSKNFVKSAVRNGSIISLDDYRFNNHNLNQFASPYFNNLNTSYDLRFSPNFKNSYNNNNFYLRGNIKDYITLLESTDSSLYFADLEIVLKKENKLLIRNIDYLVNTTSEIETISEKENIIPYNLTAPSNILCQNTIKAPKFNFNNLFLKNIIVKVESSDGKNYALIKKKDGTANLNILSFENENSFKIYNFDQEDNKNITDFFVLKANDNLYTDSDKTKINIPSLCLMNDENVYLYNQADLLPNIINYINMIPGAKSLSNPKDLNVTKVGIWNNIFILATRSNGLNFFKYENGNFVYNTSIANFYGKDNRLYTLRVKDFIIYKNDIYCIIEEFGLKIISMSNLSIKNFEFYHPYLDTFDTGADLNSVNIKINNYPGKINEFMLVLNLYENQLPLINKIYSNSRKIKYTNIIKDKLYTYLFDNNLKILYMIKRSLNPSSPTQIFKIALRQYFSSQLRNRQFYIKGLDLNESNTFKKIIFYDTLGSLIYVFEKLSEITSVFKCKFDNYNDYIVRLTYLNGVSLSTNERLLTNGEEINPFYVQSITTKAVYLSIGDPNLYYNVLLGVIISIFSIFVILIIIYICRRKSEKNSEEFENNFKREDRKVEIHTDKEYDSNEEISIKPKYVNQEMVVEVYDKTSKFN